MVIIADTSPLNYLVLVGAVRVLPDLYGRVTIPPEVLGELRHADAPPAVQQWAGSPPEWLDVRRATAVDNSLPLDEGEKAAIALALELRADRLLIDERDGREVAARLGIPVAGTLAVLRDAASAGLLDLKAAFDQLAATTFRASPRLLAQVLREFEDERRRREPKG